MKGVSSNLSGARSEAKPELIAHVPHSTDAHGNENRPNPTPSRIQLCSSSTVVPGEERVKDTRAVKFKKGAMFWSSMGKTAVQGYVGKNLGICQYYHWDFITDRLILGALPVKSKFGAGGDHLSKLERQLRTRNLSLGLVVSCVEQSEFEGYGVTAVEFVQPADWRDRLGVEQVIHLVIPDYTAQLNMEQLLHVTETMRQTIVDRDQAVYVHCKAGKGRSWVVAASFLTAFYGLTLPEAIALLKERRPQVNPNKQQLELAKQFSQYMAEQRAGLLQLRTKPTSIPQPPCPLADISASKEEPDRCGGNSSQLSTAESNTSETMSEDPEDDVKYCDLLAQALQLPLDLRIRLMEDLRASVEASVFTPVPPSPSVQPC